MPRLSRNEFRFRKHETLGAEGAEEDVDFLHDCFVDTGDLGVLRDTSHAKRIVEGRTGAGKTALLMKLRQSEQLVAWIEPDQLSLQYLSNSSLLRYLEELGVKLDIFYRLLWRHVFAVELIKLRYNIRSEEDQKGFFERMTERFFGDRRKQGALDYLVDWGRHFWEDTEYRVHEVTDRLERDLRSSLGSKAKLIEGSITDVQRVSTEDRREIVHRAQAVVNSVQVHKLAQILDCLATDVFDDPQQRYYVIVDRLDEGWVEDRLRYRLIRALIEAVRDLRKIQTAKVVVALRRDLLERVFRETRDPGFQEEKYEPLMLRLRWNQTMLIDMLDRRIRSVVRRQYTKAPVTWRALFPEKVDRTDPARWLVSRTMYRPRDMLQLGNCCVEMAVGRSEVTLAMLREAEARYSTLRFRSLGDEWAADFPGLLSAAETLKRRSSVFACTDITQADLEGIWLAEHETRGRGAGGRVREWADDYMEGRIDAQEFRLRLVKMFYEVGLVGLRPQTKTKTSWAFMGRDVLREAEISEDMSVEICPAFHRVLGTKTR